jgi:signal transduction histidine kinase
LVTKGIPEEGDVSRRTGGQITEPRDCTLAATVADAFRRSRLELVQAWLERIASYRAAHPARSPSVEMVDRMPALVDGIAWYLEHPTDAIDTATPAVASAIELCTLRHQQGLDTRDVLEDYMLLGEVLFDYLKLTVDDGRDGDDVVVCGHWLFHAIMLIEITTTSHFIRLEREQVAEREGRLQAFNRAVSHEIRNRIGTVINAGELLAVSDRLSPADRVRFAHIITRNAQEMRVTVDNLLVLARLEDDPGELRYASLRQVLTEVIKQVEALAKAARIDVELPEAVPDVDVNAAIQLVLTNYLTNAIKYRDPGVPRCFVRLAVTVQPRDGSEPELIVRVEDNGLGVPLEKRALLFQRFFRAHDRSRTQGTGLGLSIVRETVKALGGRAWADFPEKGSIFAFAVPCRFSRPRRRRTHVERRARAKKNITV